MSQPTMTTKNEVAERLRDHISDFHGSCPWVGEDHFTLLDAALATERRNTVERIVKVVEFHLGEDAIAVSVVRHALDEGGGRT